MRGTSFCDFGYRTQLKKHIKNDKNDSIVVPNGIDSPCVGLLTLKSRSYVVRS